MRDDDQLDAVQRGHEPITVSASAVAKGFSILYAVVIAALFLMAVLLYLFSKIAGGDATVFSTPPSRTAPPGVTTLDSNQRAALRSLRERERQVLTDYAWLDAEATTARIPIKRAMELLSRSAAKPSDTPTNANASP